MAGVTRDQAVNLYKTILNRDPYESELAPGGAVDRFVRSGMNGTQLSTVFKTSPEYKSATAAGSPAPAAAAPTNGADVYGTALPYAPYADSNKTAALISRLRGSGLDGSNTTAAYLASPELFGAASDSIAPVYDARIGEARAAADSEKSTATQGADRMQQLLAKSFQRQRENDPLRRQGIVSGAADQYNSDQEQTAIKGTEQDLQAKLSDIASRLSASTNSIRAEQTTAARAIQNDSLTNYRADRAFPLAQGSALADTYTKLQAAFYPNPVPEGILRSIGVLA